MIDEMINMNIILLIFCCCCFFVSASFATFSNRFSYVSFDNCILFFLFLHRNNLFCLLELLLSLFIYLFIFCFAMWFIRQSDWLQIGVQCLVFVHMCAHTRSNSILFFSLLLLLFCVSFLSFFFSFPAILIFQTTNKSFK